MSVIFWSFNLDDRQVVQLHAAGEAPTGVDYDLYEQVKPGGNFCGVKYAQLHAVGSGALDVTWHRYAKWREAYR